jgi:hypothetical protein
MGFGPDHGDRAVESFLAEGLGGSQAGQRGADDDDPAAAGHVS